MIKLDINEFLRRISIIIIEDVILHDSYSTLVWLMVATSTTKTKFKPTKFIINWLLGLVNTLCVINDYDDNIGYDSNKYDITLFKDYDILLSLQFRKSYGGMDGDIAMLNSASKIWLDRLQQNKLYNNSPIEPIDCCKIKNLTSKDWKVEGDNIAGIDFHCAPYIISNICNKISNKYDDKQIKKVIWNCSSGVNNRKKDNISSNDLIIWNDIKEYYYKQQMYMLKRYVIN